LLPESSPEIDPLSRSPIADLGFPSSKRRDRTKLAELKGKERKEKGEQQMIRVGARSGARYR